MNDYVLLAKNAIEEFVKNGNKLAVSRDLPAEMLANRAGVFVSIHLKPKKNQKEGELRGCIGTFTASKENIASEIIDNAVSACSHDYRFTPINKDELNNLDISVDILSEMEVVNDITTLNPKIFGIFIRSKNDNRSGLLLPDIPGVTTIHDQIAIALNKAGIKANEPVDIYRFSVTRYKS